MYNSYLLCQGKHVSKSSFTMLRTRIRIQNVDGSLLLEYLLLPLFQIIRRFGFSRFIAFAMHLDIVYV
jgi:hypothetical protein